ncbi:transposase family protein [Streptomyces sp. WMMC897]|uniref:transposase family protein n=1 Tax=Streptomyces sp. WMMC897 TaxID=3014782 RepID=UPI0022B621C9|nr:transposase family protein [Streptomyces sp. WMMC897]MCZ7416986.1 IS5/IS1182 family transposase [Streptomyces sp. WMMC897]
MSVTARGFTLVTYVATLDVPRHVVEYLSRLLAAHRRRLGTPRGSRALGPFRQAVLVLRWFRERVCVHCLARDAGVSQATGYRYLHEGVDVLAGQAPDLHEVLERCRREGMTHVILDGTLIETDRLAGVRDNGNDLWFSKKNKAFGGNVQFLAAPDGAPLWVSDAEPGSTPDITAARIHALPALYQAAADGLLTLADKEPLPTSL